MGRTEMAAAEQRPLMRGRLHQVAFFATFPAGLLLIGVAPGAAARFGAIVYTLTLMAQFGTSAAYHRGDWSEASRARMRVLDHSVIFLLIAGTYTPYCITVIGGTTGLVLLVLAWVGAAIGVGTKLYRVDLHVVSGFMYLGLGWLVLIAFPALSRGLSDAQMILTVAGGIAYSFGALALATKHPDPWPRTFGYHEVWHAATVVAAACFYVAILLVYLAA
jgi:hemolysin III